MPETAETAVAFREENGMLFAFRNGQPRCLCIQTLAQRTLDLMEEPEREAFFSKLRACGADGVLVQGHNALPPETLLEHAQRLGLYYLQPQPSLPGSVADRLDRAHACFVMLPAARQDARRKQKRLQSAFLRQTAFRKARLDPATEGCLLLPEGRTDEETLLNLQLHRTAVQKLTVFALREQKQVRLFLVNDTETPFRGTLSYHPEGFDGTKGAPVRDAVRAGAHEKTQVVFFDAGELDARKQTLHLALSDEKGAPVAAAHEVFAPQEKLRLCDPGLTAAPVLRAGQVFVKVRAERFAFDVTLRCGDALFSENRFSLCAGEERTVELLRPQADFYEQLRVTSAYERDRRK